MAVFLLTRRKSVKRRKFRHTGPKKAYLDVEKVSKRVLFFAIAVFFTHHPSQGNLFSNVETFMLFPSKRSTVKICIRSFLRWLSVLFDSRLDQARTPYASFTPIVCEIFCNLLFSKTHSRSYKRIQYDLFEFVLKV